jgi:ABC-type transporter MlaC component
MMNKRIFHFVLMIGILSASAPAKADFIGAILYSIVDEMGQRAVRGLGSSRTPDEPQNETDNQRLSREMAEIQDFTSYVLKRYSEEQKNELFSEVYEQVAQAYSQYPEGDSRQHAMDTIEAAYAIPPNKPAAVTK